MMSVCLMLFCVVGQLQSAPASFTTQQVATLVRQLDADQRQLRETAEKTLLELGPAILPLLPSEGRRLTPEMRDRLARIRSQLEIARARSSIGSSLVTLQGPRSLGETLQEIEKVTGNQLLCEATLVDRPVVCEANRTPFWEVLDRLADTVDGEVEYLSLGGGSLRLVPRDEGQRGRAGRACYAGSFRTEPTQLNAVQDLQRPALQGLRLRIAVAWEPRIRPVAIDLPLASISAADDRGATIPVNGPEGQLSATIGNTRGSVDFELPFQLPARSARFIASLRGQMEATVLGPPESFTFDSLSGQKPEAQRLAEATVTLIQVRGNGPETVIRLDVQYDHVANALESHRGWILGNQAYLLDSEGKRVEPTGQRLVQQRSHGVGVEYLFPATDSLQQCKLVYRTPARISRETVPLQFADIPLP